jgi:hypothetical protein
MLDGAECPNWLCADPTRSITRIRAIAYSSGALRTKIFGTSTTACGGGR